MTIQLQDFAKQILFGTTIEEKLSFPREEIVDTDPGSAIKTPRHLSRPAHLSLRENGVKATHPSNAKLVDEKERGRLLHFFGNHELLATELMALVLLKFPDAPASFRRGVLETLKEEQIHTQLYINRMKQCGIEFGELPLSDYFWKSVSSMEDPLDYVTRLSLTFEQANLDYSREYKSIFEKVGDPSTANILDKIYRDEIEHVGFGLKWFRRWKASGKSDWEAYRDRLTFPLSPARAKGNHFNTEGRAKTGLHPDFISDLRIFQQSRGRTPSIFWFNPDSETYAARNSSEGLTPGSSTVQNDLEFLPAYLSKKDDLLVMKRQPSQEFLRQIQNFGFHLPEILTTDPNSKVSTAPKLSRKIGDLRPWAWTPDSVSFFEKTFELVTRPISSTTLWNDKKKLLFSKSWSLNWGKQFAAESLVNDWIAPAEVYGQSAESLEAVTELRNRFAESGYRNIVCKAPFGTAANGIRCLPADEEMSSEFLAWITGIFKTQGSVIVEPWLERVFDFSLQLEMPGKELKTIAFTRLANNARGQFKGIVTNAFCKGLAPEIVRFLMKRIEGRPRVYHWYEETVVPRLSVALQKSEFKGPLGIDAFVYSDLSGNLRLKTIVEINPRYTMGRVAHELGEHNAATSIGYFQILTRSQIRKTKTPRFSDFAENLTRQHPVALTNETKPRIVTGSFPLIDPTTAEQFMAIYHVRKRIDELPI
ncbi:MAG: DUF455 family protein [Opitutales bacterium]|nr:DUF455 family protein [Opitutales bacterium]